jgi:hypothetical protein
MSRRLTNFVLLTGLSVLLGGSSLYAQGLQGEAKIPFTFHAQGREMAAGVYRISELNAPGLFQMHGTRSSIFVNAGVPVGKPVSEGKLVFTCYGHDCVLSEIALQGATHSQRIPAPSAERNLSRKLGIATLLSVPLKAR